MTDSTNINVGWQCPQCKNCYSPQMTECLNCNTYKAIPVSRTGDFGNYEDAGIPGVPNIKSNTNDPLLNWDRFWDR